MGAFSWRRMLKSFFQPNGKTIQRHRPKGRVRLNFEALEDRAVPATDTWTGLGNSVNWNVAANWSNGVPTNGVDLVFPANNTFLNSKNNLTGLIVNSITFQGSGFQISGSSITLGGTTANSTGQINVAQSASGNVLSLDMKLGGAFSG